MQISDSTNNVLLGTAEVKIKEEKEQQLTIRALCDNGSQVNLITQTAIEKLNLQPQRTKIGFSGMGGKTLGQAMGETPITFYLRYGSRITDNFFAVKRITNYSPEENNIGYWHHLKGQLADEEYYQSGKIDALLGAGLWIQIVEPKILNSDT